MPVGLLVTVPVPQKDAMPNEIIESAIQSALQEAKDLRGAEITPYLLARIVELTGGQSMQTNIALLKNNAAVAAQIAVALRS